MFSIKLKELREERGLSQQALAIRLNISQSTVGMWESGKREPNFETTKCIADFFGVSVDYLVKDSTDTYILNQRIKELLETDDYEKFANAMGVTVTNVFSWIRGISLSCYDKIKEISAYFNVSIDYLLGRTDTMQPVSLDEQLSGIDFALWSETQDMTDSEKQDIIDYIKFRKTKRTD